MKLFKITKNINLNLIFYNAEITPEFKILEGQISKFIIYYYYKGQHSSGIGLLVRRFPSPSRSIHFGDVSEANFRLDHVARDALATRNNRDL